jgi:hypothetical protein
MMTKHPTLHPTLMLLLAPLAGLALCVALPLFGWLALPYLLWHRVRRLHTPLHTK